MATLLSVPSYATTMCAENDTVAIVLDPSIDTTSAVGDKESMTWSAQFPYGRISGVSACIDIKGIASYRTVKHLQHEINGVVKPVVGGEQTGKYCWVRMTHPALSDWMFFSVVEYSSAQDCFARCLTDGWGSFINGGYGTTRNPDVRRVLFGSINN